MGGGIKEPIVLHEQPSAGVGTFDGLCRSPHRLVDVLESVD